jgi:enoyl-CoA hydratase
MSYSCLKIKQHESTEQIVSVVMSRPACGNALSLELMGELIQAFDSFKYDTTTRVIIVRGEGKHFCVGADLKDPARKVIEGHSNLLERSRATQLGKDLIQSVLNLNQISIAAVQGAAAGGGACIASACDFRIGTVACIIGYPEVKLGMNLSWGAVPLCFHLIGPARAKRMIIGGELESAGKLLDWGFLDEAVAIDGLNDACNEMAKFYAKRPALAAQMIKRSLNALQTSSASALMHMDGDQFVLATQSEDFKEQRAAFLDKNK